MYFVSFQPRDWQTCKRGRKREAMRCGFAPMYACLAESAAIALINIGIIHPQCPEVAVWFKSNDWRSVPKMLQYAWCNDFIEMTGKEGDYMTRKALAELFGQSVLDIDNLIREKMPYDFEYLFDPTAIKPIAEVDIKGAVMAYVDTTDNKDEWLKYQDESIKRWREIITESVLSEGMKHTREEIERAGDAFFWFDTYRQNGLLVQDHRRIIGCKKGEDELNTVKIMDTGYVKRRNAFADMPTEKNLREYIRYMKKKIEIEKQR